MLRNHRTEQAIARARQHDWIAGVFTAIVGLAALVAGSAFGDVRSSRIEPRVVAWAAVVALLFFGVVATRRVSMGLGHLVSQRAIPAAGAAIRLVATGVGYLTVVFGILGILDVSIEHLLVGAGLAGVVLGIAAQQSLGNVFAGLVLLLARPFTVGQRIRIRSGALGGIFDGTVLEISLTYVSVATNDGIFKIPNSAMLASGVGVPPAGDPDNQG